jgi:hypothetical protein
MPVSETDIKVEESQDEPGMWKWSFLVDDQVHDQGESGSKTAAMKAARDAREDWEHRND